MIRQWWMYDVLRKENSNLLLKNSNIIINFILTIHTRLLRSKHRVKVRMNKRPTAHRTGERWLGNVSKGPRVWAKAQAPLLYSTRYAVVQYLISNTNRESSGVLSLKIRVQLSNEQVLVFKYYNTYFYNIFLFTHFYNI